MCTASRQKAPYLNRTDRASLYQLARNEDPIDQRGTRLFDEFDELRGSGLAKRGRILTIGGHRRVCNTCKLDAVIARRADVFGKTKAHAADGVAAADAGKIVRHQDAGRRLRQLKQLTRQLRAAVGVMVHALADVLLRDLQSQRVAGAIESRCGGGPSHRHSGPAPPCRAHCRKRRRRGY